VKHGVKTIGKLAALAMVSASTLTLATAAPASAHVGCNQPFVPYNENEIGQVLVTANVRSGSSTSCGIRTTVAGGQGVLYMCWTLGNDGRTWTYLGTGGTNPTNGWVRDDLLRDNGATLHCPFT
jgi:hypothetical protein